MSLEHLLVPKDKEILKIKKKILKDGGVLKGYRSQPELSPSGQSWNYLSIRRCLRW